MAYENKKGNIKQGGNEIKKATKLKGKEPLSWDTVKYRI